MVYLMMLSRSASASPFLIPDGTYSVGRKGDNSIVVAHPTVSEKHCDLLVNGDEVIVRDHASRNGTYVGEAAVRGQRSIGNDQTLRLGSVEFRIRIDPLRTTEDHEPSATQEFEGWLRSAGRPCLDPPRFPVFFVPDPESIRPRRD